MGRDVTIPPASTDFLTAVLGHSREAIIVADRCGRPRWRSPAAEALVHLRLIDAVHPEDRRSVAVTVRDLVDSPGAQADITCRVDDGAGGWRLGEITVANRLTDRAIGAWVVVVRAPAADSASTARLLHRATHDSLTELPNRAALLHHLDSREGAGVAVLFIDLDGFKGVNDSMGHAAGDRLLVAVAERLRRTVRPGDTVARLGGDEFVIVAGGVDRAADAMEIAQRVRHALSRPMPLGGRMVRMTASIGVALGAERNSSALLADADAAMYRAKQEGRDRCRLFEADAFAATRSSSEAVLRAALDDGGLTVAFQPVVDLGTGATVAAEARLRLLADGGDLVGPAPLVDLAERSGLIVSVGAGILDLACVHAKRWAGDVGQVWMGLSARQLDQPKLGALVEATLDVHDLQPAALAFELDERLLAGAGERAWANLADLRALGVTLCVDGFGSGGTGLGALRRVGAQILVIDRSYVTDLGGEHADCEVVRALLGIGHTLGLTTAAKGVATAEQARVLRDLGCQLAQGAHFGPAVAADELLAGVRSA